MTTHTKVSFRRMPTTYAGLVRMLPPRPIHDEVDAANVVEIIMEMAGHAMNADQADYHKLMTDIYLEWQAEHDPLPVPGVSPIQRLRDLLDESGTTQAGFARLLGVSESLASLILSGKRKLTLRHVKVLSEQFHMEPGYFL